jgi:hypothetical protein
MRIALSVDVDKGEERTQTVSAHFEVEDANTVLAQKDYLDLLMNLVSTRIVLDKVSETQALMMDLAGQSSAGHKIFLTNIAEAQALFLEKTSSLSSEMSEAYAAAQAAHSEAHAKFLEVMHASMELVDLGTLMAKVNLPHLLNSRLTVYADTPNKPEEEH